MNIKSNPYIAGIGFTVVLATVIINQLGPSPLFSPLPKKINPFDVVKPALYKRVNTYKLKKDFQLFPETLASSTYDHAAAYAVVDMDSGKLLFTKNSDKSIPIASLTKLMTSIVALDLAKEDELFTVTERAAHIITTKIAVIPGERYTLKELLYAVMLTSANDAAQVVMDGVNTKYGGNVFIEAMNAKAKFLNLSCSHFANPQGFDDPQNYSCPEDLAILSHYALTNYPLIKELVREDHYVLTANEYHREHYLNNWNGLLGVYPNVTGVKIGNTGQAGTTTVVVSEREGKSLLVVVLGTSNVLERDLAAAELLDLGFEEAAGLQAVSVTEAQLREKYSTWKYFN
jgi:D-alanyl-D-alanine carboxypeptidase